MMMKVEIMKYQSFNTDLYINQNIFYLFNRSITEYDMKEAGLSLTKEYKLLSKDKISDIEKAPKKQRTVKLGLIQKDDKKFAENLKLAFMDARERFFDVNNIVEDDIISIKKDAIFTTKYCEHQKIGEYINFRPKNRYTSYVYLGKTSTQNKAIELYYGGGKLDVKGISEDNLKLHDKYMSNIICTYFKYMEERSSKDALSYLSKICTKYKWKDMKLGFYREFNTLSKLRFTDEEMYVHNEMDMPADGIDITYNYFNILLRLIKVSL
jgi:hypothetical protein